MKKNLAKHKCTLQKENGITLIALIVTIIVLLILAGIALNAIVGDNGVLNQSEKAKITNKKDSYYEEIKLEVMSEQTERAETPKENELFIESLNNKLLKKDWIVNTIICNEDTVIIVETVEGYEIYIDVINDKEQAKIRENSFGKIKEPVTITYDVNGGDGENLEKQVRTGLSVRLNDMGIKKKKYTLVGWCENPNPGEGEIIYSLGSSFTIDGNATLYAIWEKTPITVNFYANEGTGTMGKSTIDPDETTSIQGNIMNLRNGIRKLMVVEQVIQIRLDLCL